MDLPADRLRGVIQKARQQTPLIPSRGLDAAEPVRSVPDWVARLHALPVGPCEWWLLCERAAGSAGEAVGQFVFATAAGRYMVDTYDPTTGECVARESAEGGPIVAGLACPERAALVHIYRVPESHRPPT